MCDPKRGTMCDESKSLIRNGFLGSVTLAHIESRIIYATRETCKNVNAVRIRRKDSYGLAIPCVQVRMCDRIYDPAENKQPSFRPDTPGCP